MFLARGIAMVLSQAGRKDGEESHGTNYMLVFVLEMVFSFLGMFVVTWFSRYREYRADAGGARVAGKERMIGALAALSRLYPVNAQVEGDASVATLKISPNRAGGLMALLSTHPPIEERIARLQAAR
jgi:heat shock protein HtpX